MKKTNLYLKLNILFLLIMISIKNITNITYFVKNKVRIIIFFNEEHWQNIQLVLNTLSILKQ